MKALLKSLVIDTATSYLYIGMFEGDDCLEEIYQKGHNDHSVTLMDELSKLFERLAFTPKDLDRIIVGVGPGSYTGVRVGVVVAKMLGYSLAIPVYTVSSLALLASASQNGRVMAWIDARRKYAFIGGFDITDKTVKRISEDVYDSIENYESLQVFDFKQSEIKPNMVKLFHSNLLKKVINIHTLTPTYLRKTEAERQLDSA